LLVHSYDIHYISKNLVPITLRNCHAVRIFPPDWRKMPCNCWLASFTNNEHRLIDVQIDLFTGTDVNGEIVENKIKSWPISHGVVIESDVTL